MGLNTKNRYTMKTQFIRLLDQLMIILMVMLLAFLPSVYTDELMQGTVIEKMFFFCI